MGQNIQKTAFTEQDHERFVQRIKADMETLEGLLNTPGWGVGPRTIGAELELYLTDPKGRPARRNMEVLALAKDPLLTEELNRFNLEFNCPYTLCRGRPFEWLGQRIDERLTSLRALIQPHQLEVTPIGILPTLLAEDFGLASMTDSPRYHALTEILSKRRGGPFQICIQGKDRLVMSTDDMTLEGANTSFQVHLRVNPDEFASWYNAVQLASPFVLALAANSPLFMGHRLWHETRLPLFKQSIDCRNLCRMTWNPPARVSFGKGYVRHSAIELFRQGISLMPVLLPECDDDAGDRPGRGPALKALRLHQGTVWSWNRAVYDDADGGHLRIELRSLPAGPTTIDMLANAALAIGLASALRPQIDRLMDQIPFEFAEYNFYRAGQSGLGADMLWPDQDGVLREMPLDSLMPSLLDQAEAALREMGIDPAEAQRLMEVHRARLAAGQNGARWQLGCLQALEPTLGRQAALAEMFARYRQHSIEGRPVTEWPCP
ncbi:glutamate-cysteine ligase family protein [Ferrimonas balearica]|uniref:glutamate-cysteine ligase family protein n=1 Tax=Ferrimonas balearica TaxID=44012 RepID=UPI001C56B6C0|nr:glutamate-cysteine ligase family protein [Ferrimonas balearica]MBW3163863.1 glutamate--cysteine ligase [Ferrimonas balearica]MBY6223857.1 glutamate--cysteine ligase [Ferrimonas balearica]